MVIFVIEYNSMVAEDAALWIILDKQWILLTILYIYSYNMFKFDWLTINVTE